MTGLPNWWIYTGYMYSLRRDFALLRALPCQTCEPARHILGIICGLLVLRRLAPIQYSAELFGDFRPFGFAPSLCTASSVAVVLRLLHFQVWSG